MRRVIAVVEGQTERNFVQTVLAPWLGARDVGITARLVGNPGHKGGGREYARPRKDILKLLKQESQTVITTMFDFYGMVAKSWPGRAKAAKVSHAVKAKTVEDAIAEDIATELDRKRDRRRFIPYIQMYEFEALLFTLPTVVAEVVGNSEVADDLNAVRAGFKTPEEINDHYATAPSKRIAELCPTYQKTLHGILAAQRIGIDAMRQECPHFNEWLTVVESFGGKAVR